MESKSARIIKGSDVRLEGSCLLGATKVQAGKTNPLNSVPAAVKACIIDSQPDYAVIEFTCSCGTKTQIKCDFSDSDSKQQ